MNTGNVTLLLVISILSYANAARGTVSCVSCIASRSGKTNGYDPCYNSPGNISTTVRCADRRFYCQSVFIFNDGGTSVVQRGCADPHNDQDESTSMVPSSSRCTVTTNAQDRRQETKCFYACESDYCNNVTMVSVKTCNSDCSASLGNGRCDYATGICICETGWGGDNCEESIGSNLPFRRCVQCNERTDSGCRNASQTTTCPGNIEAYPFCAITRTTVFDQDQIEISSYVTRGCAASYSSADECYFSRSPPDPNQLDVIEYTCTSTCEKDGCNTYLPDGLVSNGERKDVECLVCESSNDESDCALGNLPRTRCPSNMQYCKSVVSYYISEKKDLRFKAEPEYKFRGISRKCARHSITARCKHHRFGGFHASKVKCEETCTSDGCNVGWPTRPMCSQCNSNYSTSGYDSCWDSPVEPTQCPKPYQGYCVAMDSQLVNDALSQDGYRRVIHRGCSYHNVGSTCSNKTLGNIEVRNCNRTCSTSGCNLGVNKLNKSSSLSSSRIFVFLCLLLQWLYSRIRES